MPQIKGAVLAGAGICKTFGALTVLENADFSVGADEAGIVGPNGAGTNALLRVLAGGLPASGGTALFRNADVTAADASQHSRLGIAKTHQTHRNSPLADRPPRAAAERIRSITR